MKITQTTINFAKRRGLELTFEEDVNDLPIVCFWEAGNDCEWMFSYRVNGDSLSWNGNIYLSQAVKEELPATITSDKHLREVIEFLGNMPSSAWTE
ncbi:hypothetical protein CHUUTOTORO_01700 [Serratia phage vB_SmaM-ChuuTotoro]|nr:hypothetical protein CHUUTOTORO_01700 [Serratia phage vB_SmaM-ChuuTotoro]